MREVLPRQGEGNPEGDWPKEFADQVNTDAVLASAILAATSLMNPEKADLNDLSVEDTLE